MDIRAIKVVRMAAGEDAAAWRDALAKPGWADAATVLKEDRGSWVRRANLLGRDVVVKCRELNTIGRRFKHAIGMGHGAKHWRGAERLKKAGIATGRPLAFVRAGVDGAESELLVVEFVQGKSLLQILSEIAGGDGPPVRVQHAIARAVGRQAAVFGRWTIYNRDYKPSNLVVISANEREAVIAVIDCVGVYRPLLWRGASEYMKTLKTLAVEAIGCGVAPRRALMARVIEARADEVVWMIPRWASRARRQWLWHGVAVRIKWHGDPRPRVNPLAENRQSR